MFKGVYRNWTGGSKSNYTPLWNVIYKPIISPLKYKWSKGENQGHLECRLSLTSWCLARFALWWVEKYATEFTGDKESLLSVHFFRYLFSICLVFFSFYYQNKYIYRMSILKNRFKSNFIRNNFRLNGYHHLKSAKSAKSKGNNGI